MLLSFQYPLTGLDFSSLVKSPTVGAPGVRYNLVATVSHEGPAEGGKFRVHVLHKASAKWFELDDVRVEERQPQTMQLLDVFMQVWERQPVAPSAGGAKDGAGAAPMQE